jgi:predicted chitinase
MSVRTGFLANGVPAGIAAREAPLAEKAMIEREITTQQRATMFIAQVLEESVNLQFFEEIASGREYEGRRDLGNIHPGDGPRYKGRGPIQLTGRANYRWAGGRLGLPLEAHPELAARHDVGWRIAALYWQSHGLNELADQGKFVTITQRINGGMNGYSVRLANLRRVSKVDCRPAKPRDSLWYCTADERRWCHEYDRLLAHHQDLARRRALRAAITEDRKRIWRAAQQSGWSKLHRRARYHALLARTS